MSAHLPTGAGRFRECWIGGVHCDSLQDGAVELARQVHATRPGAKIEYHTLINAFRLGKTSVFGVEIARSWTLPKKTSCEGYVDLDERTRRHKPGRDPLLPGVCAHRLGYSPSRFA